MPRPVSFCIAVMDGKLGGAWVQGCATPDTLEYVPFSVSCDFNFIIPVLLCVCVSVIVYFQSTRATGRWSILPYSLMTLSYYKLSN